MVSKFHGVIAALSLIALASNLLWLPPLIQANYGIVTGTANGYPIQFDLAAIGNPLSVTAYHSGLMKCTFYENVFADYTDGTFQLVGTQWNYPANPFITQSIVNPSNPTRTISDFAITLSEMCNNIPSYVSSTTVSGSLKVYAQVSGSDGQQHVLLGGTNVNVPTMNIQNGVIQSFYSYKILPSQISQYNSQTGTNPFTLKVYVQPILNYISTFTADSGVGAPQTSTYSGWVTQLFTGNVVNGQTSSTFTPQPTSSLPACTSSSTQSCIPSSPTSCPSGTVYSSTYSICLASNAIQTTPTITPPKTTPTGTTIATGTTKFFYSLVFTGDPSQYCGIAVKAPSTGCVVAPTGGPLSVPLSSFNIIGSTRGTIDSLQTFNIQPVLTPSVRGLNLNPSTNIVYTGALVIDGKTIALPSSAITSDNKAFVDGNGDFRFPTATISPVLIDQVLKQNGVQPSSPDNLVIRTYANGKFTGTGPNGNFQGVLSGPYIDISVWYISNTAPLFSGSQQLPPTGSGPSNPNCNFGTNPDGTCKPTFDNSTYPPVSNPSPPTTSCPAGQQAVQVGISQFACVTPPTSCPSGQVINQATGQCYLPSPPPTPPNPCVNVSAGGICLDPAPNPPTPTPFCVQGAQVVNGQCVGGGPASCPNGQVLSGGSCQTNPPVIFPNPDPAPNPITGQPPYPSYTCTSANASDCNNQTPTTPAFQFDQNTTIGIAILVIAIISIIVVVINQKRNN